MQLPAIGSLPSGKRNLITDVEGVRVGHFTVSDQRHQTGVTVVMPCADNPFTHKLTAASHVINGFGKTQGLVQLDELGTLETPIALTNTLNIGKIHDAMVAYMISQCEKEGLHLTSVNPIVAECNDASLNDIQDRCLDLSALTAAIENASADFEQGAVGAGRGMTCHGLKGGVGSASRVVTLGGRRFTFGVLALCNHGSLSDLTIAGDPVGQRISETLSQDNLDKGSCILIVATDAPLSDRQLRRALKRCTVGLARAGSYLGHGSGDIAIGFTTKNRVDGQDFIHFTVLREELMYPVFRAVAESTEEAVLNALYYAEPVSANGKTRHALKEFL